LDLEKIVSDENLTFSDANQLIKPNLLYVPKPPSRQSRHMFDELL